MFILLCDSLGFPVTTAPTKHTIALWTICSALRSILFPLLVTWQAHGVAIYLISFHARFCFKHPLGLLIPGKKKVVTVILGIYLSRLMLPSPIGVLQPQLSQ